MLVVIHNFFFVVALPISTNKQYENNMKTVIDCKYEKKIERHAQMLQQQQQMIETINCDSMCASEEMIGIKSTKKC